MLEVKDLHIHFRTSDHDSVKGVSFTIGDGEIVGLVGESGSGKTITSMAISGLMPHSRALCTGSIVLDGEEILTKKRSEMRILQGGKISVVFQEPMTSMDPCMRIGRQVEESLLLHTALTQDERKTAALKAMRDAELPEPERVYNQYPHELSGGMLQRAMIAAAIINEPSLLICDEPTTALDVTIQAQILKLLQKINREKGTSILFITHDLHVVRRLCTRTLVMQKGLIVEQGETDAVFRNPQHAYTQRLIRAIPTRAGRLKDEYAARKNGGGA